MTDDGRLASLFAGAGVDGYLHAVDLDTGREMRHRAGEPVVLASVVKLGVLVELFRRFDAGEMAPEGRVRVTPAERSAGPTGLSVMKDDVELSWRDLAQLMIAVSDNAATDVITLRLGKDPINATLRELGLGRTVLRGTCREIYDGVMADLGLTLEQLSSPGRRADPERIRASRQLSPEHGNASTAEETTRLLGLIWRDEAASPDACAAMRRILYTQVWPHRLSSGFGDGVRIGAKTGTLFTWRNEAGVVELPDGGRVAVAVFTRDHDPGKRHNPAADAVIGSAARLAVDELSRIPRTEADVAPSR
ncbi:MAG: serine hydrolase [Chloroflexi bacterium]|nr:MAG: serine hydrolase [Chloroflexota bacterium]